MCKFNCSSPALLRLFLTGALWTLLLGCTMPNDTPNILPRSQSLPKFNPYKPTFDCQVEATKVPAIDAQADAWFMEALALEGPETIPEDRDYKKIVQLTRQAAERKHWKAMLNLASLYLEGRDPLKGEEDAVKVVEDAMRLGVPAAYDRVGTYFMNGTGVDRDETRALAFWQKAAEMGNPQAMTFLGEKFDVMPEREDGTQWSNMPVAKQMLECAHGQGYGEAAYELSFLIAGNRPPSGSANRPPEQSARVL